MSRRREPSYDAEVDAQAANYTSHSNDSGKRDKRRQEMISRIERLKREGLDKKEPIFAEIISNLTGSHLSLLNLPLPTHPSYLFRLSELSIERDIQLSSNQQQYKYAQETLKALYDIEMVRIQQEYTSAKKAVKEKLLEACDERARKLREEKEGVELNLESFFETQQPKAHATRQHRVAKKFADHALYAADGSVVGPGVGTGDRSQRASSIALGQLNSTNGNHLGGNGVGNSTTNPGAENNANAALTSGAPGELFPFSLLPSSPLLAQFQFSNTSSGQPTMLNPSALLSTLATFPAIASTSKRTKRPGPREKNPEQMPTRDASGQIIMAVAGMPTNLAQYSVQPGRYDFLGKSLLALKSLAADEVGEDLEGLRSGGFKKRRITAYHTTNEPYLSSVGRRGAGRKAVAAAASNQDYI